jgi:hypothetical protein
VRRGGHHLRRPAADVLELTGNKARAIAAARRPACRCWRRRARPPTSTRCSRRRRLRLPGVRQGRRRRRRPRHAPVDEPEGPARGDRGRDARGRVRVRRPDGVPRAGRRRPAAHRGADPRRRRRQRRSTCSSATARCSAATRRSSRSRRRRTSTRAARPDLRRRGRVRPSTSATSTPAPSSSCSTREGNYVFIEMNPRIQVEHTVTEEVTDVDLVQSQLRIASGETLADLGLTQDRSSDARRRAAVPDHHRGPGQRLPPDTGKITPTARRAAPGVRLDGGTTYTGAEISAHFDSMLVKLTCRGRDFETPSRRARRAVAEFRIRGVATNIPFLQAAVLDDPDFRAGGSPRRSSRAPALLTARPSADRGTKLLTYLADVTVNQPHGERPRSSTRREAARRRPRRPAPTARQRCCSSSARGVRRGCAARPEPSRSPTRRSATRTSRCSPPGCAPGPARVAPARRPDHARSCCRSRLGRRDLRRRAALPRRGPVGAARRAARGVPNICLQMLLRGRNTVGYTPYPTEVTDAFVEEAAATGIDIFRIFDALNDVEQMRPAIDAVRETGTAVAEVALCYTGDLSDPAETLYTLDYYLRLAEQIVDAGAHVLAIKDMAGLLRAPAARTLVTALRERVRPAGAPAHPRHRGRPARHLLAAIDAGVDAVDARWPRWPAPPAAVAVGAGRGDRPHRADDRPVAGGGVRPGAVLGGVRKVYAPFESGLPGADRPRLPPRDPRRAAVQPAPAGDRARPGRPVRGDRGHVRRRRPTSSATWSR